MTSDVDSDRLITALSEGKTPLEIYWDQPVHELVTAQNRPICLEEAERYNILSLLTMAIVLDGWNGNKRGQFGNYPQREGQRIHEGLYEGGLYIGHNIGALAVDLLGQIIDFDFNHNDVFCSSVEHAEARLVRRVFSLDQAYNSWQTTDEIVDTNYSTLLNGVTIFTSLESCAQCSGIMTLGNVRNVVYLQEDPGQYMVGNILYNLSNPYDQTRPPFPPPSRNPKYGAPEPISANLFGFKFKKALEDAYKSFQENLKNPQNYFWQPPDGGTRDCGAHITSFLCTDQAKMIFKQAAAELDNFNLKYPDYRPELPKLVVKALQARKAALPADNAIAQALRNIELLDHARRFREYVGKAGHRGTPHK